MELVDVEDVETIIALYCGIWSDQNTPIHLFVELVGVEPTEDLTAYGEEHGAQEPYMVAPISYVDSESILMLHPILMWLVMMDTRVVIIVIKRSIVIVIPMWTRPHMSLIDPNAAYVVEFSKYPKILPAHRLAVNFDPEELFCLNRHYILGNVGSQRKAAIGGYELHLFKIRKCGRYENLLGLTHAHQHARFQFRVSYRKAWISKQMAIEQLYGDFDASYNELRDG
ncbi:hypothetical protein GOBAR_AA01531 [Gossypium barbadense]|uniref:Uncharacterized protein n=1 Tax=Gossypium barbadense TaxID=3634 RepID=A0A2P5YTW0_GOSBA|nr:hypothetical protein GOBAR_AA01531 [Gossypium barbadense]